MVYLKPKLLLLKKLSQIGLIPEEVKGYISTHTVIMSTNRLMQVGIQLVDFFFTCLKFLKIGSKIFTYIILGHYTPLILGPANSFGALPYLYTNEILHFIYLYLWEEHTHNHCMYLNETLEKFVLGIGRFKMEDELQE